VESWHALFERGETATGEIDDETVTDRLSQRRDDE
jgi:hypothetical protein